MKITRDEHGHIIEILNSDGSEIRNDQLTDVIKIITEDEKQIHEKEISKYQSELKAQLDINKERIVSISTTITNVVNAIAQTAQFGIAEYNKYKIKYPNKNDSGSDNNGDSSYVDDGEHQYSAWEESRRSIHGCGC